jgi:predicted NAD/FAD-binding protein
VLNRVTYPNLLDWFKQNGKKRASLQKATFWTKKHLKQLGVSLENSEMSFSVGLSDCNIEWSSNSPFSSQVC